MYEEFGISKEIKKMAEEAEKDLELIYKKFDEQCLKSSMKVLKAFQDNKVSTTDFNEVTGYGYYDGGRDKLEKVYAQVFNTEDALVRPQIMSGTHALYLSLSALLKYGDTMISVSGEPYDTIRNVIGISGDSKNSLVEHGIKYEQIDLINNDFDYESIAKRIKQGGVKLVEIQRSRGYANRKSLTMDKIEKAIKTIKEIDKNVIILVDNCYGEFVEEKEPTEVGADLCASSLMKNLGAGIATSGGYIVGKESLIEQIAERLAFPSIGKSLGANFNRLLSYYKGLYMAPRVVNSSLKTMAFASRILEKLNYSVSPKYDEKRTDIIQTIELMDENKLVSFCQNIQKGAAVESYVTPIPSEMPGYPHKEIMAGGSFTPGSTIELSCDGPLCPPYTAYMQGGLTYEYGKLEILIAVKNLLKI
ncbi:MAG: aminotransferase class I/II-fold pyridoxal phosphate-dependent enzyme [Clostridia bacterium]|nr:aminotransferase class I/II-fold pyridoxal phosphate-dependent enzyme [Clostridia bacterium]